MTSLRDELQRLGGTAPDVRIAPDTWAKARHAHRLVRLKIAAAMILVVSGGLGLLGLNVGTDLAELASRPVETGQAVPSELFEVPVRFVKSTGSEDSEVAWSTKISDSSDLAVGRAAAALTVGEWGSGYLPVVVLADSGDYRPLSLPGFSATNYMNTLHTQSIPLTLSPDGFRLAYAWWDPKAPLDSPMPAGVRILDLTTGAIQTFALTGGNGINVTSIAWSPDSEWVAWVGDETKSWTPMSSGRGSLVAGRIDVEMGESESAPYRRKPSGLNFAIASSGTMTWQKGTQLVSWDAAGTKTRVNLSERDLPEVGYFSVGAYSPSGKRLALEPQFGPGAAIRDEDGGISTNVKSPQEEFGSEASTRVLGWVDERHVVLLQSAESGEPAIGGADVVLASPGSPGDSRTVGHVDQANFSSLSVAVDLMTLKTPTVERPEPDWPWSSERKWIVFGIPGFLGLIVVLWWWGEHGRRRFATPLRR